MWNAAPKILQSLSPVRPGPSSSFQAVFVLKKQNRCLYHGDSQRLQIMARIPFRIQDTGPGPNL